MPPMGGPSRQGGGIGSVALGPRGPGVQGPTAAMQALQQITQDQAKQAQKAMIAMQRVQQEAHQQTSSAVADIANQVAGGMQKLHEERKARKEKVENLQISEEMAQFNQQLQQNSAMEMQRLGTMMKGAQDATLKATTEWRERREKARAAIDAGWQTHFQMLKTGEYSGLPLVTETDPETGETSKIAYSDLVHKTLKTSEAVYLDDFDPSYLAKAVKLEADAQRDIVEGRDPMDLAAYYAAPPSAGHYKDVKSDETLPTVNGRTRFQMQMRDGWPKGGLLSLKADDPLIKHVRMVTPGLMNKLVEASAREASFLTQESRDKYFKAETAFERKRLDFMDKHAKAYEEVSDMFTTRSVPAVEQAIDKFVRDPDPSKFKDTGERFALQMFSEMFPQGGTEMTKLAQDIHDGTTEFDTTEQLAAAMHVEAAAATLSRRARQLVSLHTSGVTKGEKGEATSDISRMTDQWIASLPPGAAARTLGLDPKAPHSEVLAAGQFHIQKELNKSVEWLEQTRRAANKNGALQTFAEEYGTASRYGELLTVISLANSQEDKQKAKDMLSGVRKEGETRLKERAQALDMTTLQQTGFEPAPQEQRRLTRLEHFLQFLGHVKPEEIPIAANILAGGPLKLSDDRMAILDEAAQTSIPRDSSGWMALMDQKLKDRRTMLKAAKEAQDKGTPWTAEQGLKVKKEGEDRRRQMVERIKQSRRGATGWEGALNQAEEMVKAGLGEGPFADVANPRPKG